MAKPLEVFLELGQKKVFASAANWPGWCRSAKSEKDALATLAAYAPRYAVVADRAGISFSSRIAESLTVIERLKGGAATDFGVPEKAAKVETLSLTSTAAKRLATLVTAAWAVFDEVASQTPEQLRKGPRGGGRDRDKIMEHVLNAEAAYGRKLGIALKAPVIDDVAAIEVQREAIAAALAQPSDGTALVANGWTSRYAARRIAWHVLDHAWEMQDKRP